MKKHKIIFTIIIIIFLSFFIFAGCDNKDNENDQKTEGEGKKSSSENFSSKNKTDEKSKTGKLELTKKFDNMPADELENYRAIIKTKFGEIKLGFFPDVAPNHVKNFLKLADSGFYNDTTFHRVIPGFMIQGGDPNSKDNDPNNDGMGDPGYTIDAEFNDIPHVRGVLSMARSRDPNSAGSQFFIMHKDNLNLDGQYSAFGKVVEGLEVVDKIANVKTDDRDRPIKDVKIEVELVKDKGTVTKPQKPENELLKDIEFTKKYEKMSVDELKKYRAVIKTKLGEIHLKFYPDVAPNHVKNFLKLADSEFYDGTTFHRVIPGFMIQGGDINSKDDNPNNDGMGDPGYTIDAEFSDISHKRGILSMARAQDPNSAGSQFFIMHKDYPSLDGKYSVFGGVVKGIDVVDKIVSVERDSRDRPMEDVKMDVDVYQAKEESSMEKNTETETDVTSAETDNNSEETIESETTKTEEEEITDEEEEEEVN